MDVGILSQMQDMKYDDILIMIKMLKPYKECLTVMLDLFGSEKELIKFLDLFAGQEFKVPSRSRIYFVLLNIQVYNYYKSHIGDEDALLTTAHRFDMTTQRVKTIVERVSSVL